MALRDEIAPKQNKLLGLADWLNAQSNRDEWLAILLDEQYSSNAVAKLLTKYGFACDWNVVFRYREKHAAK